MKIEEILKSSEMAATFKISPRGVMAFKRDQAFLLEEKACSVDCVAQNNGNEVQFPDAAGLQNATCLPKICTTIVLAQ